MSGIAALAPFRTRSFRFQWPADLCTAWALEMETLILGWYVLVESGSVVLLTVFGALQLVGTLVSPVLGVLGDRLGLRNVLAGMRVCYAVFASLILFLALTRQISPTLVLMVAAMSGLVRPTDIGMRSALVGATMTEYQGMQVGAYKGIPVLMTDHMPENQTRGNTSTISRAASASRASPARKARASTRCALSYRG